MNLITNKTEYGQIKAVNVIINEIMARKNDIEMYSTHNEGKSVVTERFIGALKNKIYKYMTDFNIKKYAYQ